MKTKIEWAEESCDLPDGAYYAMIGDLMGIDYGEVMDLFAQQTLKGK